MPDIANASDRVPRPAVIHRLPYPVARPAAVAFGSGGSWSPQVRLWNVPHAAYQVLRMACLAVASDYLCDSLDTAAMPSQPAVQGIALALSKLAIPDFESWAGLLECLAKRLKTEKVGLAPCLPLAGIVEMLRGRPVPAIEPRYGFPNARRPQEVPAHRALQGLRNGLAHGGDLPADAECDRLLAYYLPVLEALLEAFAYLADCELLVREGACNGEWTLVRRLVGPAVNESTPLGDDEGLEAALRDSPVVLRLPEGRLVGLSPLFAAARGPVVGPHDSYLRRETEATEPVVGLYDGHVERPIETSAGALRPEIERRLFYLGAGNERWEDSEGAKELLDRLERRKAQWRLRREDLAPWTMAECTRFSSFLAVDVLWGIKYFPDCYVDREELRRSWQDFLRGGDEGTRELRRGKMTALTYRNGLVLVGAAGAGKSAWAVHTACELLAEGLPPEAGTALDREGRNLVVFLRGDMLSVRAGRDDRLLPTLLEQMGLRPGAFRSFGEVLAQLSKKWPEDLPECRRLVVILDALNEAPFPEELLREALSLVQCASAHPWCRVVITLREEFLTVLRGKAGTNESSTLVLAEPYLYQEPERAEGQTSGSARDPVVFLPLLTADAPDGTPGEAATAYERYREHGLVDRPGCPTPWRELAPKVRQELESPLLLYLYHRTFSGRPAGTIDSRQALFRAYVESLIRERPSAALEEHCREVVALLLDRGRSTLDGADAMELRERWQRGRTGQELRVELSPLEALEEAGLLRRRDPQARTGYLFVFESVLEYLIFRGWAEQEPDLPLESLRRRAKPGAAPSRLPAYWNAFYYVFQRLLGEGRSGDWPELVNDRSPRDLDAVAARVWVEAALACGLPSDASQAELAATPAGRVVAAFASRRTEWAARRLWKDLWGRVSELGRPEWVAMLMAACRDIYSYLVKTDGRRDLLNDLAGVHNNLGNALGNLGDLAGAIAAFGQARDIRIQLVDGEGRRELRNYLAMVFNNLGNALQQQGDLAGAITAYRQARDICAQLVDGEGRRDLLNDLASVHNNLGDALRQQGDLAGAIAAFGQARDIYAQLVEAKGRRELRKDLAAVHNNLGVALGQQGGLAGAIAAFAQARDIYSQLVETEGRRDLLNDLAGVHNNLGNALGDLGDLAGAIAAFGQARDIRTQLVKAEGRHELRGDLASVHNNLGNALRRHGDLVGAIAAFGQARDICAQLVKAEDRHELRGDLAGVHNNLGNALGDLGDQAGAITAYRQARDIYAQLVDGEGRRDLLNDLASAHNNLGDALRQQGDLAGAITALGQARDIRTQLVKAEGRRELRNDLASVHYNLGIVLRQRGDLAGAITACRQAADIYAQLVEAEGRSELLPDLCMTIDNYLLALRSTAEAGQHVSGEGAAVIADAVRLAARFSQPGTNLSQAARSELLDLVRLAAKMPFTTAKARETLLEEARRLA